MTPSGSRIFKVIPLYLCLYLFDRHPGMLRDVLDQLNWVDVPSICCLGLGSPSESRSARLQLALILELIDHAKLVSALSFPNFRRTDLSKPLAGGSFYDPVFTDEDMSGFEELGIKAVNGKAALVSEAIIAIAILI